MTAIDARIEGRYIPWRRVEAPLPPPPPPDRSVTVDEVEEESAAVLATGEGLGLRSETTGVAVAAADEEVAGGTLAGLEEDDEVCGGSFVELGRPPPLYKWAGWTLATRGWLATGGQGMAASGSAGAEVEAVDEEEEGTSRGRPP